VINKDLIFVVGGITLRI